MGLTLDDINRGVADIGGIVTKGIEAWRTIEKKSAPSPPAQTTQPYTTSQPQGPVTTQAGLAGIAWLIGGIVLVILLAGRRP
jgi:hypothetical protein